MDDDHTRYSKAYLLKDKTEGLRYFKAYVAFLENEQRHRHNHLETPLTVECLQYDSGTELVSCLHSPTISSNSDCGVNHRCTRCSAGPYHVVEFTDI